MVPYAHQRSNDVERRQYHRNDLKLGHIASGQENGVVVLRKVLAALAGDLRPNQQLVVQSKKYCGCRVEANVPRVLDGLGMFLHPNATPPEDQLQASLKVEEQQSQQTAQPKDTIDRFPRTAVTIEK
uniref:(northern house mosquito) hypothetical protein n=1 Tax=Culex pipiens TaxID=7175 RepID=A0A8D8I946_CULPI